MANNTLTRIGVFYDGNYFLHVSNYYAFNHHRRARIDVAGLHEFIKRRVAEREGCEQRHCQIVDAHYFRGRLRAQDAEGRDLLLKERIFDDILSREGITNHHLPVGPYGEKGIDVWLALEAYELTIYKRFDVVVLIASDGDFLPLVRKLNTIGTRVMLLGWDFKFVDRNGQDRETKTSQMLLEEASYPILMHQEIEDRSLQKDPLINGLFVKKTAQYVPTYSENRMDHAPAAYNPSEASANASANLVRGKIYSLKTGYGFIEPIEGGQTLFFLHADVLNADFNELQINDAIEYQVSQNDKGPCAVNIRVVE